MFWADRKSEEIEKAFASAISARKPLIIRDEKTASGRVHVGSMRGVAIHGLISEILEEKKIPQKFIYEINDFDPMDGLPVYLDEGKFRPHLGKPLYLVPSPDSKEKNYAEYFAKEFMGVIEECGFNPSYEKTSELYLSGKMNEVIKISLEKSEIVRKIFKEVSGSKKEEGWLPINVICEKCNKVSTTKATDFDGETVAYSCENLEWTNGCGNKGRISPFDGKSKLSWKVEWAAKWKVREVHIEGGGKDHSTKGGSRDVANHVSREVFEYEPPFDIPYEFFLIGGEKMSSSKGKGSSAREIADLVPPQIFRLALIGKDIKQAFNFNPEGDTIPVLYDTYDTYAEKYWSGEKDDTARIFFLSHPKSRQDLLSKRYLPRFSQVAFLAQMKHLNLKEEISKLKGDKLSAGDERELEERARYAKNWLSKYAPEDYRYELKEEMPKVELSSAQREALEKILSYVKSMPKFDGQETHSALHEIRKSMDIKPDDFFGAIYMIFLGKKSGPKAGWFLSVLDKDLLISRLSEAVK